jgi:RIO kinase 1
LNRYDSIHDDFDTFSQYETELDPMNSDRQARRRRKPKTNHTPKKSDRDVIAEITETTDLSVKFETTYRPARHEAVWLLDSLRPFYDQGLITDVMAKVKGGKEANVYRCAADPATGVEWLAAKVYRPRMFRNLRNDKMYREGRTLLGESGRPVKERDQRVMRAVNKKTDFGEQVEHTSWLMYEYNTMQQLHALGADVPKPLASGTNGILMTYCGDEDMAAPTLSEVTLERREAGRLFEDTLRNINLLLQNGLVHGDLSAYNILYWDGAITLIDFPQVAQIQTNPYAQMILERDITRVCEYFAEQGLHRDPKAIASHLWWQYTNKRPLDLLAEFSRLEVEDEEDEYDD